MSNTLKFDCQTLSLPGQLRSYLGGEHLSYQLRRTKQSDNMWFTKSVRALKSQKVRWVQTVAIASAGFFLTKFSWNSEPNFDETQQNFRETQKYQILRKKHFLNFWNLKFYFNKDTFTRNISLETMTVSISDFHTLFFF